MIDRMTTSTSRKPAKANALPDPPPAPPGNANRLIVLATFIGFSYTIAWAALSAAADVMPPPRPDFPPPFDMTAALWRAGILIAAAAAIALAINAHLRHKYERASEDYRVRHQIARILGMTGNAPPVLMKVKERDRNTPVRVVLTGEAARRAELPTAQPKLVAAFAHAAGILESETHLLARRGKVTLYRDTDPRAEWQEPESAGTDTDLDTTPVPVVAPDAHTEQRVRDAMIGALESDKVEVFIAETHPNGAPQEVRIKYPTKMAAKVRGTGKGQVVLETMTDICPPQNDVWHLRHVTDRDTYILTDRIDPLARLIDLPPVEHSPDLEVGVVIGKKENGDDWRHRLMGGAHTLIAGQTGAGKGSVLWNILRAIAPMVADGRVRLWVIDPKRGVELGILRSVAVQFATDPDEQDALLKAFVAAMNKKGDQLAAAGLRKLPTPVTAAMPLDVLVIDELGNIAQDKDTQRLIKEILQLGRFAGCTVIGAMQNPKVEEFKHRDGFTVGVALKLTKAVQTDMVLGSGARNAGAFAEKISDRTPGVAYTVVGESTTADRVRCAFVSDEDMRVVAATMGVDVDAFDRSRVPLAAPPIGDPIPPAAQEQLPAEPSPPAQRRQATSKAKTITAAPEPIGELTADYARAHGRQVTLAKYSGPFPVVGYFDGDPDPVTVTAVEPHPEDDDRCMVTYSYDGEGERVDDLDDSWRFTIAPAA